jgi:protein-S-isoprenylcysteine O-methyltransferase Ste14
MASDDTRASVPRSNDGARDRERGWRIAGYLGVAGFFGLEVLTRRRGAASRLDASEDDRGTTRAIVAAYAVAGLVAPGLRRVPVPRLPPVVRPVGVLLEAIGLGIRAWSMRALADSYTRTLRVEGEQRVVETGPYRLIRHPGYLGSLLIWIGLALTSRNVIVVAVSGVLLGGAYRRRIIAEERLLLRDLRGYGAYRDRTRRLVPFLW